MVIRFRPGKLGAKPDGLTRQWDVYPKEGDSAYARVNPQNFRPVFTQEQLTSSLRATLLEEPVLRASIIMDEEQLHKDISEALGLSSDSSEGLRIAREGTSPRWKLTDSGLLLLDERIYVPDHADLRLRIL